MTKKEMAQRIVDLERRVQELEARQFSYYPPVYQPPVYVPPPVTLPTFKPTRYYVGDPIPNPWSPTSITIGGSQ